MFQGAAELLHGFFTGFEPTNWVCVADYLLRHFPPRLLTFSNQPGQKTDTIVRRDATSPTRPTHFNKIVHEQRLGFFWVRRGCFIRHITIYFSKLPASLIFKVSGLKLEVRYSPGWPGPTITVFWGWVEWSGVEWRFGNYRPQLPAESEYAGDESLTKKV